MVSLSEQEVEALANGVVINSRGFIHNPNCGQVAGNRFLRKPRAGDRLAGCCHRMSTPVATKDVDQIIARHVAAALEQAADAIDQRIAKNIGGHPFSDHDRGLAQAKRIVRAQIHN